MLGGPVVAETLRRSASALLCIMQLRPPHTQKNTHPRVFICSPLGALKPHFAHMLRPNPITVPIPFCQSCIGPRKKQTSAPESSAQMQQHGMGDSDDDFMQACGLAPVRGPPVAADPAATDASALATVAYANAPIIRPGPGLEVQVASRKTQGLQRTRAKPHVTPSGFRGIHGTDACRALVSAWGVAQRQKNRREQQRQEAFASRVRLASFFNTSSHRLQLSKAPGVDLCCFLWRMCC